MKATFAITTTVVLLLCAANVSAGNCQWTSAPTSISFGNYSVFNNTGDLTANSTFTIQCTPNTTGRITLSRGINSLSFNPRTLAPPSGTGLNYNLFVDPAASSQIWGDGTGGSTFYEQYNGTPKDKIFTDQIFGRLFAVSDGAAGTYTDTVTAFLTFGTSASLSQQFTITTTVIPECQVATFGLDFGSYDPLVANASSAKTASAILNVYCTKSTAGTVSLNLGLNSSSGWRYMKDAATGDLLQYNIYMDPSYGTVWNTTNVNSAASISRWTPLAGGFVAYGAIPPGQDISKGSYKDTVQATVNY